MKKQPGPKQQSLKLPLIALGAALVLLSVVAVLVSHPTAEDGSKPIAPAEPVQAAMPALDGKIVFRDAKMQAEEFIGYYHSIKLTPEQEAVKRAALEPMPAACCRDSSAYTCCCPCNLSKTLWGLSNLAIARHGANVKDVRQLAESWLAYVNPSSGFSGDSCYKGGCSNPAHRGGCAGMEESKLDV